MPVKLWGHAASTCSIEQRPGLPAAISQLKGVPPPEACQHTVTSAHMHAGLAKAAKVQHTLTITTPSGCLQACHLSGNPPWNQSMGLQNITTGTEAVKHTMCLELPRLHTAWSDRASQQAQRQSNRQCLELPCLHMAWSNRASQQAHRPSNTLCVWSCRVFTQHGQTEPHKRHRDSQTDTVYNCLVFPKHAQGADLDPSSLAHRPCATSLTACAASCVSCSRGPHWVRGVRPAFSPSSSTPRTLLHCSKQA